MSSFTCTCSCTQVMDSDTLISIALKFDTTPAEIARVNKKPFFGNVPVYPGEVRDRDQWN